MSKFRSQSRYILPSGGGGGPSGGSYVTLVDLDLLDLETVSAITSGTSTLQFASSSDEISVTVTRFSGANGDVTPTNGQGILMNGGSGSGTVTISFSLDPLLASYTREDVFKHIYVVQLVVTNVVYPLAGASDIFTGVNRGNTTTHNSGKARGYFITDNNDGTNEDIRVRNNTSSSSVLATTAIKTSRVFTTMIFGGQIVQLMDTSGTTPPTPVPGGASPGTTVTAGGDSVSLNNTSPIYQANGLRLFFGAGDRMTGRLTRLLVKRFQ